ncbi:sugar-binding transcriptional regulator [Kurthia sibirica]|uniref:Uncharacterized protein n=1 Tax=Kurthia sibirica TaxID=202750 RepID=A0A2U3AI20_9BACL|nr:sugar-binding domain-containing protein [Kurthia sibirica]PWI24206.1 hypothetical protein DEX24_14800 [Kurthia sibirica]GEK34828.1 central glycolytic genes regulator [Kurthia sibirica]
MLSLTEAQLKMLPEMSESLQIRYRILQMVQMLGPIGRRSLSDSLSLPEREVRKETDLLREQQLLDVSRTGMTITSVGIQVLEKLKPLVYEWSGISDLEIQLQKIFGIQKVIIVDGNLDSEPSVKALMGAEAVEELENYAKAGDIVAVTGGSTVAAVANAIKPSSKLKDMLFIAARGGMGVDVQMQANTIASNFATNSGNDYKTLYLPEYLSEAAYNAMKEEPIVVEMIELYEKTSIVIHGIGAANEMADRRKSSSNERLDLEKQGAVGEAFGYYFDEQGKAVQRIRTVGLQLEQVKKCPTILAVAGGAKKAKAILSYFKNATKQTIFITDMAAAQQMFKIIQK